MQHVTNSFTRKKIHHGFTLLELMVAIAIFALVSVIATYGLRHLIDSQSIQQQHAKQLSTLQMAHAILKSDMQSFIERPIRTAQGLELAFISDNNELLMSFTRTGVSSSESTLQRISYKFNNQQLLRLSWPVLDRPADTLAVESVLLKDVMSLTLRFADTQGQWHDSWPPANSKSALPSAIAISMQLADQAELPWLFLSPQGRNYVTAAD